MANKHGLQTTWHGPITSKSGALYLVVIVFFFLDDKEHAKTLGTKPQDLD